jgi:hypothetical protein
MAEATAAAAAAAAAEAVAAAVVVAAAAAARCSQEHGGGSAEATAAAPPSRGQAPAKPDGRPAAVRLRGAAATPVLAARPALVRERAVRELGCGTDAVGLAAAVAGGGRGQRRSRQPRCRRRRLGPELSGCGLGVGSEAQQ